MRSSTALLAGLVSICSAQSVVQLLLPVADDNGLVGSILGSDATATTYFVTCASSSTSSAAAAATTAFDDSDNSCGLPGGLTVTEGPATVNYFYSIQDVLSYSIDCSLQGTTSAYCTNSINEQVSSSFSSEVLTSSIDGTDLASAFVAVTITAGAGAATQTTGSMTTTAGPSSTGSRAVASTGTAGTSGAGTQQTSSTASHNAAMPAKTGAIRYVAGGLAMAIVAAL